MSPPTTLGTMIAINFQVSIVPELAVVWADTGAPNNAKTIANAEIKGRYRYAIFNYLQVELFNLKLR